MNFDFKKVNLYLIGMMGAGKSTLGKLLAQELGYRFLDTDAVIEAAAGQPVTEIFATAGEAAFRELETQVLGQAAAYQQMAIARAVVLFCNAKTGAIFAMALSFGLMSR